MEKPTLPPLNWWQRGSCHPLIGGRGDAWMNLKYSQELSSINETKAKHCSKIQLLAIQSQSKALHGSRHARIRFRLTSLISILKWISITIIEITLLLKRGRLFCQHPQKCPNPPQYNAEFGYMIRQLVERKRSRDCPSADRAIKVRCYIATGTVDIKPSQCNLQTYTVG